MTAAPAARRAVAATAVSDRVAATGLVGAATLLITSVVTALPYRDLAGQPYSPLNHFVSELGERGVSTMAQLFDTGLMVGGVCLALFLIGLAWCTTGSLRFVVAAVGVVAGAGGLIAGVEPMNEGLAHLVASVAFFVTVWIAIALFTVHVAVDTRDGLPRWLLAPGAVAVIVDVVFVVVYAASASSSGSALPDPVRPAIWIVPLLEWLALLAVLAWVVLVAVALLRRPTEA